MAKNSIQKNTEMTGKWSDEESLILGVLYLFHKYELMHMYTLIKQYNPHHDWYVENICEGKEVAIAKPAWNRVL